MSALSVAATTNTISNPPVTGTTYQKRKLREAFQELYRNGTVGKVEAMALRNYGLTIAASSKFGASVYTGKYIVIHPDVLKYGRRYTAEVIAHEMGHAIFWKTGLYSRTSSKRLPPGVDRAVDEAFAGVLANRVKRAQYSTTPRSSLLNEFFKVVSNPFYQRYYGINIEQVRANRGAIYDALRGTVPTLRGLGVSDATLTKGL